MNRPHIPHPAYTPISELPDLECNKGACRANRAELAAMRWVLLIALVVIALQTAAILALCGIPHD